MTIVEKIIAAHSGTRDQGRRNEERPNSSLLSPTSSLLPQLKPGDIIELGIDVRVARDFGGANVVKNLEENGLGVADPAKTFFTFDCNPTASDQKYAANQQACRVFARNHGIKVFDVDAGIGTHIAVDNGLIGPGDTIVSTDSHANILGAIGTFGQGMGDQDIAHAWAYGKVWFEVPATVKVELVGMPRPGTTPKDVGLALLRHFGANGLLGLAAEVYGEYADKLSLDGRLTISSLGTEMGAIIIFFPPNQAILDYCRQAKVRAQGSGTGEQSQIPDPQSPPPIYQADTDAVYERSERIDITDLEPLIAKPGHPEDVVAVASVAGRKIDSAFIGSCTNGRMSDLKAAAEILKGRKVAPGVVLKVVPTTDEIWREALRTGIIETLKQAGALVGNAGCAGCAAGQIGQNGPGEVTVSTGNRNFAGKQGKGDVYIASPETTAASAIAGAIVNPGAIPVRPALFKPKPMAKASHDHRAPQSVSFVVEGRVWVIPKDNIDTDMIFHNRHLTVTDIREMGQYAFGNLAGWEHFSKNVQPGDIVITGKNFGAGSSRQQAVDCFKSLKIGLVIARSFGAIYFRNAVNVGFPVMVADLLDSGIKDGDRIRVNLTTGEIELLATGVKVQGRPFPPVQIEIYRKGGLLG
ncbi:MAG TPA: aconitase family protein [bacterium]|nr:aconitase family protein [bacterium]